MGTDLSLLSIETDNLEKLKSSSAMNNLINKFVKKGREKSIFDLNCMANLAITSIYYK